VASHPEALWQGALDGFTAHAVLTLDAEGTITSWNSGAERLFGLSRDRAVGMPLSLLFTKPDRDAGVPGRVLAMADRDGSVSGTRWFAHGAGNRRYVNASIVAVRGVGGPGAGYAAIGHEQPVPAGEEERRLRDILAAQVADTTRRLSESNTMLTTEIEERTQGDAARIRLLRRLVAAEEDARRRIARDLHDDLGQQLTALRLTLQNVHSNPRGDSASKGLGAALEMLSQIDRALDFLAWELRPAALDECGLNKVLESYVHEWSRYTGVTALFHAGVPDAARFASEIEASVYRIVQEALNNVAKHARARAVNVLLEQRGEDLVLAVEDDGVGVRPPGTTGSVMGLTGMHERAAAVGGTVDIEPTPAGGTTVLARIPMAPAFRAESRRGASDEPSAAGPDGPSGVVAGAGDPGASVLAAMRARLGELQHAVAARDEFIATVAHELRNPVSPLIFQLRLAIEKTERTALAAQPISADWAHSQLRRIEQHLHRLLETLDRLLDVSRLSTGRIDLELEPVNLAETVRDVIGTFDAELAVARCTLTFVERGEATGVWDRVRLEQICRNLVSNAIRFGAGRPIEVSVVADQDFATLEVRDYGVGIAPAQHARIFERFERGPEQRSGGFGIGLWVVKNVSAAMGGTVAVESEPGEGARFTVMLPRRSDRASAGGDAEDN